jgi:hypothetical protein
VKRVFRSDGHRAQGQDTTGSIRLLPDRPKPAATGISPVPRIWPGDYSFKEQVSSFGDPMAEAAVSGREWGTSDVSFVRERAGRWLRPLMVMALVVRCAIALV